MKKALLLFLSFPAVLCGQNLVPNPGFEDIIQTPCSCMQGEMGDYIKNWQCPSRGTSDILNDAATVDCYANPHSQSTMSLGSQTPHGGHGMAMIMTHSASMVYREYVGVTLSKPLVPGRKYYAEMYVSLADRSGFASNNIGFCFFTGELTKWKWTSYDIVATPQVNCATVITDTAGWVKVSGTFVAKEASTFVVIGNFFKDDNTIFRANNFSDNNGAYHSGKYVAAYYVDDIVVRPESMLLAKGDTLVHAGNMGSYTAWGCNSYRWANAAQPDEIISNTAQMKATINGKTTFYVYGDNGDTAKINVDIYKNDPLYVKDLEGRKVKKGKTINLQNTKISITVFDKDEIDGDSVSLYFGDSCIVQHCSLTHKKKTFTFNIDPDHPRQLILFAENEGTKPPNTAAIIVKDGRNKSNLVLSSDLKSCDSVLMVYKEK